MAKAELKLCDVHTSRSLIHSDWILRLWLLCYRHTVLILTRRAARAHDGHKKSHSQMLDLRASGQAQMRQKIARDWVFVGTPLDAGLPLVSGYSHVL